MLLEIIDVSPFHTNCYIVGCETELIGAVIDPGDNPDEVMQIVNDKKLTIKKILLTHAHIDHVAAAEEVRERTNAVVYIHKNEEPFLDHLPAQANRFGLPRPKAISQKTFIKEGDELEIGTITLTVLDTPGHSPGGICLLGEGFVFVGDVLFQESIGRTDLPGGSMEILLKSIREKLLILPQQTVVYPGHGPKTTIGDEIALNPFL